MKNLLKILLFGNLLLMNYACAQTVTMKTLEDSKKIQTNKNEFIGKPLSNLLKHINLEVKSIIPSPNKNMREINRLSFLFVSKLEYKNAQGSKPTRITVVFNQNWDLAGERCTFDKVGCTDWTKEDEKNLGNLIVHDIYVTGKN